MRSDRADYQTMFAHDEGSVAAPTAGLHFTAELVDALAQRGIAMHKVTLHVGAGTFLPVKADDTAGHRMHPEAGTSAQQTADALNAARRAGGRIVAVGSTSLRLLESAADEAGVIRPFCRRDRAVHHARLSLSRGRRDDDQFPPAALDPVHAGVGILRA